MLKRTLQLRTLTIAGATILLAAGVLASADRSDRDGDDSDGRGPRKFTFALWGDTPYSDLEKTASIPRLVADINESKVAFTVFDGDIKSGSSLCTDDVFSAAIDRFNSFEEAMIYVPGDNEWTDCHRRNNGGYDALTRLDFLRTTMFATPYSFGQAPLLLEHQGTPGNAYVENTRWTFGSVVFVGLNIPGSNNNKVVVDHTSPAYDCMRSNTVRTDIDCNADNDEYVARDAANIAFLHDSFDLAKARDAAGVFVVIQADMGFDLPETETVNEGTFDRVNRHLDGYDAFLTAITTETRAFAGQVVLVHGDTHFFKIDKPLTDATHLLANFTRVETFGSPNVHWVKVTVDAKSRPVFRFEPMIVPGT